MSEQETPKRKRVYVGRDLERRRAYQREYNQKKRDEMKERSKPKASQQFTPVAEQDAIYKAIAKAEAKGKVHSHQTAEILAELERDKEAAIGGWHDESLEFFAQFK